MTNNLLFFIFVFLFVLSLLKIITDFKQIKMEKQKLYFKSIDDTFCSSLESHLDDARCEELKEITLIEAIPDNDNTDYIWCTHHGEVTERSDCKKSICSYYESKSGRGKCKNKGSFFIHGEEVTFTVPTEVIIEFNKK